MLVAVAALLAPLAPAQGVDVPGLLAGAVDLPTPEARAAAARELAKRDDVTLEQWLDAARGFAPRAGRARSGTRTVRVDLVVDGTTEPTELHLYVPKDDDLEGPRPLLVALHGAGGTGAQMIQTWRATADRMGAILLAPTEAGANRGYTGEARERRSVLEAIRWTRRHHDVDERRVHLTGYSRGGHVAWDLALRHADVFASVSPQAGGPRFDPTSGGNNMRYVENLRGTAVRALVGEHDSPTMVRSARRLADRAAELEIEGFELVVLDGKGHLFDPHAGEDWAGWFAGASRAAVPASITRVASRADEAAAGWLEITAFGRDVKDAFTPTIRTKRGELVDEAAIFERVVEAAERRSARVTATHDDDGTITLDAVNARSVRLLVPAEWISDKGLVSVRQRGRPRRVKAKPEPRVLLETFVERFDRGFLPVARVDVRIR